MNSYAYPIQLPDNGPWNDIFQAVKQVPVFQALPEHLLAELLRNSEARWVAAREKVYEEGDEASHVFTVLSGVVRTFVCRPSDGLQWVSKLWVGPAVFGYQEILSGSLRKNHAEVQEKARILWTPKSSFLAALENTPRFAGALLREVNAQWTSSMDMEKSLVFDEVPQRLAALLVSYVRVFGVKSGDSIFISKNTEINELAHALAVNRKSIQRALAAFTSQGLVRRDRKHLYVTEFNALFCLAGQKSAGLEGPWKKDV